MKISQRQKIITEYYKRVECLLKNQLDIYKTLKEYTKLNVPKGIKLKPKNLIKQEYNNYMCIICCSTKCDK